MSIEAVSWATSTEVAAQIKDRKKQATLIVLAECHNSKTGRCDPDQIHIAARLGCSVRTVRSDLRRLDELGVIARKKRYDDRGKRANDIYTLGMDMPTTGKMLPVETVTSGNSLPVVDADYRQDSVATTGNLVAGTYEPESNRNKEEEESNSAPSLRSAGDGVPAVANQATGKAIRGTRIPPGWRPDDDLIAFAHAKGWTDLQIQEEAEAFVDYWKGVPAARGIKQDWPATFRNRIRDLIKRGQQPGRNRGTAPARPSGDDQIARAFADAIVNERYRDSDTTVGGMR